MSKTHTTTTNERLVAIDWGRDGMAPIDLIKAISEAANCTVSGTWFRDQNDRMVCHVDYDRRDLRPSHAHGIGYRLGWLVHCEILPTQEVNS
jgi:hypothetical protein